MNPAIALGIALSGFLGDGWDSWKAIYLYPTVPFGGAVLAVIFYEFIYKKTIEALSHLAEEGDMGHVEEGILDDNLMRQRTMLEHPVRDPANSKYIKPEY